MHSECVLTSDRVFFNETIVSVAQLSAQRLIAVGTEPGWILTLWLSGMFTTAALRAPFSGSTRNDVALPDS